MNLNELKSFKLADAVKFHSELNPKLWKNDQLDSLVKKQLLIIAEDFIEELGISGLDVVDVTVSGSNAAYSYTPHSDLDLHILVDMSKLPEDEVYRELFNAKKTIYNDSHDITVHGVPVELYVQDAAEPVVSLGEYSIVHDKWIKVPKRKRANFDQNATKAKYEQLARLIKLALKSNDVDKINKAIKTIKRYRKAGLDKGGEFGPENLAYKALRSQGAIQKLYDTRDKLHSEKLSIEEFGIDEDYDPNGPPPGPEFKPTMPKGTVRVDVSDVYDWYKLGQHISNMKGLGKHDFGKGPPSTVMSFGDEDLEHQYIKALAATGLGTTDIDPASHKKIKGQKTDPTYNVNETAEENQIVNVVSNIAATQIAKVMKAKESKLLALLDGGLSPKEKLELFGVKVKDLNVPNVNDPLLKKLFNILYIKVNSQVDFYDDPSAPKTLGGYYDGDYTVELFFPAIEYVAGKRESQLKSEIASTLAHEIQHAIDDYKSDNKVYAGSNISPAKDMQGYLKLPYEVNARFQEATMDIAKYITMPKNDGSKTTQADLPELIRYAFEKNRLDKIYEKNQKEYKRLLTRAYKFFQAELNSPKKATPIPQNIAKRALNWILGKQTKEINEASSYILSEKATLKSTASQIYMCEGIHYSKDMLLEQKLYEDFMGSAKQFLGAKFNTTMANIKGQVNDTINAGIIIKDVASNPELMNNVTAQLRKWTSQLVKEITRSMQGIGEKLNVPQLMDKLISVWKFISQKITEFGSSPGWKGFLGSLGIYGFVKFISDMLNNLTTLKSTIASGALDALVDKAKDLGQTIVGNITLPGFLGIFDKLTTVKKYFLDVLNKVKEKFSAFTVAGSPQFSKGVQLEASGYIPSEKEKNDPVLALIDKASDPKKKIQFKVQKGNNKFATTLVVNGEPAGVYQYDANTSRSIAEVYPEYKGKGLGKLLVLHAIYTAAKLGLDFIEDESRTAEYDNVLDSLSSNGYIVDDDGYWYVTGDGENYLKQSLNEASGYIPSAKEKNDPRFKTALTVDVKPDSIKKNAKAFNWKTSRAGIPPQANPSGKF